MENKVARRYQSPSQKGHFRSARNNQLFTCWALVFASLVAVVPVEEVFGGIGRDADSSPSLRITVRLYNHSHVPAEILQRAEDDVAGIFRRAGVDTGFVDCPLTEEQGPGYLACQGTTGPSDFVVNLVTPGMANHLPASADGFGLAVLCAPRQASCTAYVNYERARQLAPGAKVGPSVVLGRVLSHELGHLLGLVHSESGLMRGAWNPNDFDPGSLPGMVFTNWDCQRIHAEAPARATERVQRR